MTSGKQLVVGLLLGVVSISGFAGTAHARGGDQDPTVTSCRGGGGFPGPFGDANLKAELSDSDIYLLRGKVVFLRDADGPATAYFEVDLQAHPWLANAHRQAHPYYALLGANRFWRNLEGQNIELSTQAQGQAHYDANTGTATYDIGLFPIAVYLPDSPK